MTESYSLSVLIIEDDPDARANLQDILELDGHRVQGAGSAAESLAFRELASTDVILLDRKLPDMGAERLLPRLKSVARDADVVIVTGQGDFDSAVLFLREGASDYLLKPINSDALRASLRRITERHRLTQRLLQTERLAALGEAMASLVHESRNALQRSQAGLEILSRQIGDNPAAKIQLQRIQAAQDDLHQLYEEVREYAAPLKLRVEPCRIRDVLDAAWQNLDGQCQSRDVAFTVNERSNPSEWDADPLALRRVFRNILENSLAACSDPVRIEVDIENVGSRVVVRLRDNGPGLSLEQERRIFEPFYTTKTHGTGLGMAICRRIVEGHNGTISLGPGPGAEIIIRLPARSAIAAH
jgi:signal transduction histidine kinase